MRNRTADLLLTMETLCLLSYGHAGTALSHVPTGALPTDQDTHSSPAQANRLGDPLAEHVQTAAAVEL